MHYTQKLKDLSHPIQRLEEFEERLGITLKGLCLVQSRCWGLDDESDDGWFDIDVNGEVHPVDGLEIDSSFELVLNVYDSYDPAAKVVSTRSTYVDEKTFFGFATFSIRASDIFLPELYKVLIYPQAASI